MSDRSRPDERPPPFTDGGYVAATDDQTARWGLPLRQLRTIARTEYRLSIRSRWALALTCLFAFFGAMLGTFSGSAVGPEGVDRVIASLTSLTVYLVPLAALAFGYDAVVGREEEGWLEVVFALPVSRARVVTGTFLGRATVLAGAISLGFGFVGLLLLREYGLAVWPDFVAFLAGTIAIGTVFLGIAMLVSTVAREKTHALGLALLVWVWFVLVHDLLALGVVAAFELPSLVLTGLVLLNPVTVFRLLVLGQLGTTTSGGFAAAFATTALAPAVLTLGLLLWCVLPVAAASVLIRRRRL